MAGNTLGLQQLTDATAVRIANQYGLDPNTMRAIFHAQINQESGFQPRVNSSAGAEGIAQIVPKYHPGVDPYNPKAALNYAANWDAQMYKKYGDWNDVLSVYNSGQPWAKGSGIGQTNNYVKSILAASKASPGPQMPKAAQVPQEANTAPQEPAQSGMDPRLAMLSMVQGNLASYGATGKVSTNPMDLITAFNTLQAQQPQAAPPTSPNQPPKGVTPSLNSGKLVQEAGGFDAPVVDLTSTGGLHDTEGLPGYPAHDYFAPSGSGVVAPISGRVIKLSGHDPANGPVEGPHGPLGWSVYIKGTNGKTYYLTHLGTRNVKLGATIKAGQPIGTVANYSKYGTPSHIHMGIN